MWHWLIFDKFCCLLRLFIDVDVDVLYYLGLTLLKQCLSGPTLAWYAMGWWSECLLNRKPIHNNEDQRSCASYNILTIHIKWLRWGTTLNLSLQIMYTLVYWLSENTQRQSHQKEGMKKSHYTKLLIGGK